MVGSFRLLRGFSVWVDCSSASGLLLPRVFDVTAADSLGGTTTGPSGRLMGLATTFDSGTWERVACKDLDNTFIFL